MEDTEATALHSDTDGQAPRAASQARVRARWYSLPEAAGILGVTEPALRKRLRDGSLTAIRAGRGWRILLPGEPPGDTDLASTGRPDEEDVRVLAQTAESLVTLVRDLQRQSLVLAAQIGYLQNQLVEAQASVRQLTERAADDQGGEADVAERTAYEALQRELEELRARQPPTEPAPELRRPRFRWLPWRH